MTRWHASTCCAAIVAVVVGAATASIAAAQDVTVPMPGGYSGAGASAQEQIPDPSAILQDDGSTFSIPVPGGGEIQVQGPQSETPNRIPPTENWAVQRNTPFSVGGVPMGPAPVH